MPSTAAPLLKQLTPVIIVEQIEPCLAFWTDRFGFTLVNQVPGPDGKPLFAILQRDGIEIMYQTKASVLEEDPSMKAAIDGHSVVLFVTVESIDAVEKAVAGAPVVKPRHQTFYGSTEMYVREPGGNTVGFAQMNPA